MPEITNILFGRTKNDTAEDVTAVQSGSAHSGGADLVVTDQTSDTSAIDVEPTGTATVEPADTVVGSTEADATGVDPADSLYGNSDDTADQADDDEPVASVTALETSAEESAEAVTEEAAAEDIDEPVPADAGAAPDAAETELVVEPVAAETRPAAGTRGNITVGDGVVAKVVTIVVGKVDGVHGLADDGISVEVDDDIATIKLSLVIEFGHAIKTLAEQIRTEVIEAVEQFLALDVAAVDIHVSDIQPPAAA